MTETAQEKLLLQRTAEGDERAFRELFDYWQPIFSNYIFGITKSKEVTAELVQDVFLKIWLQRESLHGVENFRAYLYAISRNESINALRKAMRELQLFKEWDKVRDDHAEGQRVPNPLHDQLDLLDEAISKLTDRQRQVYQLHRHERLTYQQIAERLGIGKETVKTHLEASVKAIRKYLENKSTLLLLVVLAKDFFK